MVAWTTTGAERFSLYRPAAAASHTAWNVVDRSPAKNAPFSPGHDSATAFEGDGASRQPRNWFSEESRWVAPREFRAFKTGSVRRNVFVVEWTVDVTRGDARRREATRQDGTRREAGRDGTRDATRVDGRRRRRFGLSSPREVSIVPANEPFWLIQGTARSTPVSTTILLTTKRSHGARTPYARKDLPIIFVSALKEENTV